MSKGSLNVLILVLLLGIFSNPTFARFQRGVSITFDTKPTHVKKVALTFDACPAPAIGGYDSAITSILIENNVPATLFLSGRWVRNHIRETVLLASTPQFEIGNHSYSHPHMKNLSDSAVAWELKKTQEILWRVGKKQVSYFRPPYGEYDDRISTLAKKNGLELVEFDLASGDPDTSISAKRLARYVIDNAKNGSIVVFHMNGRGRHTAEALGDIITGLRARGFEFAKVSELERH
jgi:peptidoglycan/xylan/chitin deacetylase (PgdA/CDA1 family)